MYLAYFPGPFRPMCCLNINIQRKQLCSVINIIFVSYEKYSICVYRNFYCHMSACGNTTSDYHISIQDSSRPIRVLVILSCSKESVGLLTAQFNPNKVISDHYLSPIHMKSWPKMKLGQVEVGSNIAQNHLSTPRKSYLVIICFNSQKLTKSEIRSS